MSLKENSWYWLLSHQTSPQTALLPARPIWKAAVCEEKSNSLLYPEAQLFAFASPNLEAEFQHLKDWILLNLEWLPLYLTFQNQIFRKS